MIALSIALGVFCGIIPLWGYQLVIALFLAHIFKLSKVIAGVASNISIPPMIPFIVFGSYWTGCKLMGKPLLFSFKEISIENAGIALVQYVVGAVVMAVVCGVLAGLLALLIMRLCGRKR